ncbi:MAG TPA: hypothetical protein VIY86_06365, partial [Pirellulaceae bacterium]
MRRKLRQIANEVTWTGLSNGCREVSREWLAKWWQRADSEILGDSEEYLNATLDWLGRAQDARPDGGVSAYYSLYGGFGPSYLETTGYIIPTWLRVAAWNGRSEYCNRARRAADWLLTLQHPTGGFPSGFATPEDDLAVFDTGQIVFGLLAIAPGGGTDFLEAARKAGRWLVEVQDPAGSWTRYAYEERPHVYYTMVAWSLVELFEATGDATFRDAALRNVQWVVAQQQPNGWFSGYHLGRRPVYLHFIAYTLQGLLEVGVRLGQRSLIDAVRRGSESLLQQVSAAKTLTGAYDAEWNSTATYECVTGLAQMSLVFQGLARTEPSAGSYLEAAWRLNQRVRQTIRLDGPTGIRGAVKGSQPVWGRYLSLRYP